MPDKTITDKIDFSKSEQYTLSIRLSTDGFSFSIYNPISDSSFCYIPLGIKSELPMAVNVKDIFQRLDFLQHPYKRINVLSVNHRFTLIPFEVFDEEQTEDILYQNHPKQENEIVLYNILKRANTVTTFSMDKSVHQLLEEQFNTVYFYSQASPLIEYFAGKSRIGNSKKMYAYLRDNSLEIYCFDRGKLMLANSFNCNKTEDRMYYILYIWEQLNFSQERDELHFTGLLKDKGDIILQLNKYLKQVFVINPKSEFNNSELTKIEDIPFDLQALFLCEL
ncbi:MAG: DUF3822 family protein [Bacteroidaceae bacterium]